VRSVWPPGSLQQRRRQLDRVQQTQTPFPRRQRYVPHTEQQQRALSVTCQSRRPCGHDRAHQGERDPESPVVQYSRHNPGGCRGRTLERSMQREEVVIISPATRQTGSDIPDESRAQTGMMGIDNGFECVAHANQDAWAYRRLHNLEANAPNTTIGAQNVRFATPSSIVSALPSSRWLRRAFRHATFCSRFECRLFLKP